MQDSGLFAVLPVVVFVVFGLVIAAVAVAVVVAIVRGGKGSGVPNSANPGADSSGNDAMDVMRRHQEMQERDTQLQIQLNQQQIVQQQIIQQQLNQPPAGPPA